MSEFTDSKAGTLWVIFSLKGRNFVCEFTHCKGVTFCAIFWLKTLINTRVRLWTNIVTPDSVKLNLSKSVGHICPRQYGLGLTGGEFLCDFKYSKDRDFVSDYIHTYSNAGTSSILPTQRTGLCDRFYSLKSRDIVSNLVAQRLRLCKWFYSFTCSKVEKFWAFLPTQSQSPDICERFNLLQGLDFVSGGEENSRMYQGCSALEDFCLKKTIDILYYELER